MTYRSDARLVRSLTAFCTATSLFTIATGMAALLGSGLRIEVLRTWWASPIGTQLITAVCLILLGVSLWLLRRTPHSGLAPAQKTIAYATAGLAGLWGLLGCMEHLPGAGLSRWLLAATTLGASDHLGKMSPVSALDLFLFGLALLILDWRPRPRLWPAQVLCFLGGIASLAVLLDYVLDPGALRTAAALPSAIVFAAFSLAAVCARPQWGIAALFASQSLGGTVLRRLFFIVVVVPVLISWIRWRSLQVGSLSDWAIITVTSVALLSGLIIWTALIIERVDGRRVDASLALRASEEQMRLLLDGIKDYAIYSLDPEGRVTSWNEGARRIKGYQTDEILGQPISLFYIAEDVAQDKPQQALKEALLRGRHESRGLRVRKDGSRFWASDTITPLYVQSGTLRGFSKVLHDVSERRQMEEALLESKGQLAAIISSAMDAIIAIDSDHRIVLFNPAAEKMFGIPVKEVTGDFLGQFIPESFRARHTEHICHFGETGVTNRRMGALGELRGLRSDGTEFPIEASISQSESGGKKLFTVIVRDITVRRQAEEALRISERRYRRFVEHNPVGVLRNTLEGEILECNDSLVRMLGYSSRQELLSCRTPDLHFDPADRETMLRILQRHKTLSNCEIAFKRKDGTALPTIASITLVEDENHRRAVLEATIVDIGERKHTEEALQHSEERLRLFIEHAPAALAMFDREMRYLQVSRRWRSDYGLGDRDLRGVSHYEAFPEIPERWKEIHRRALTGEVLHADSDRFERSDGSVQWIRWDIRPWHEAIGEIGGIVIFAEDITERKRAEEALRESEERFEAMANGIPQLAWMAEADGHLFWYNQRWYEYTGTNLEQMQGWGWQSVHDPDVLPAVLERWKASIAQGEAFEMEFPLRGADGRFRTFLTRGIPLKDSQGRVLRWFGTNTDISERKEMEESLRDSERRVRALMDSTAEAILGYDPQGNCTFCNPSALRLLGYEDSSELLGKNIHAIIHHSRPDGTPLAIQDCPLHRAAQAGQVFHADDLAYWRKDGACFSVECWSHPVFENGKAAGSVLTFFDITERKQAEERLAGQTEEVARQAEELARSEGALRAQTSLLQSVLDSLGEGLIVADQEGKFSLWNPAAWKILGSGPANISPEEWSQNYGIYLPDQITPFPTDQFPLLRAVRGESATAEMFIRNPGREQPAWIEVTGRPLKSDDGTVRGGVVAFRDITESKAAAEVIQKLNDELEQRVLQRTAELQAANQELQAFSYSVSHDLRAPLRHIGSFSKLLMEEFGPKLEPEAQHYLERITEGTRHMGQLVDELLNLARVGRHELSPQITGLNSIVQEVVTVLKPETEGRQVEWKIADLPFVECDPMLVKQVFQNLLANALKFTRPREQAVVEISQQEANGEPVLMVRDNGVGFSMKYADKLFGVFQRLHRSEDFEGTGVGLATVQRIVQKHGGRVWAEAELDHGATFYFTLGPAADKHMEAEHHTEAVGV